MKKRIHATRRISRSPECGRHLVAARDLAASELILRDAPAMVGPSRQQEHVVCVECFRWGEEGSKRDSSNGARGCGRFPSVLPRPYESFLQASERRSSMRGLQLSPLRRRRRRIRPKRSKMLRNFLFLAPPTRVRAPQGYFALRSPAESNITKPRTSIISKPSIALACWNVPSFVRPERP